MRSIKSTVATACQELCKYCSLERVSIGWCVYVWLVKFYYSNVVVVLTLFPLINFLKHKLSAVGIALGYGEPTRFHALDPLWLDSWAK